MSDIIKKAEASLLQATDITEQHLKLALDQALGKGIDSADLYLQSSLEESWYLEDGIVKSVDYSHDRGFGLRVISGDKVGFAFADNIMQSTLTEAATIAKSITQTGHSSRLQVAKAYLPPMSYYPDESPLSYLSDTEKVQLLLRVNQYARQKDARIQRVFIRMSSSYDSVMVLDSDGVLAADLRPLVHFSVQVIAEERGRSEQGRAGGGARFNLNYFLQDDRVLEYVDAAVQQALINLRAQPAPAGIMPVVLGPGWPAVLLHEAIGHGLEADHIRKGSSVFCNKIGEKIASSLCTIIDDGTIHQARGSLNIDDEGVEGQKTVLIKDGILTGYMTDKLNAKLLNLPQTGNGRRESYACPPIPRMTTTYMLPGSSTPEEIINSIDKGLYAVDFLGGQVDTTSGKFVFSMSEAYMIENGKLTYPVKGATLIGYGTEVLEGISMVANDFELDPGIGTCGKEGQSVEVGVGQPTLKLDSITVGGTQLKT